jgi:hypothetical protein
VLALFLHLHLLFIPTATRAANHSCAQSETLPQSDAITTRLSPDTAGLAASLNATHLNNPRATLHDHLPCHLLLLVLLLPVLPATPVLL